MLDDKVKVAIDNWAPRFTSQGIDYNDFVRTTSRIHGWENWCREWCATADVHHALGVKAESRGDLITAGEAYIAAALCYHFGKFMFQDHRDEYMDASRKAVDAFARGVRLLDPTAERMEIPFDGTAMVGTLRRPTSDGRAPLILLLPGLDSTKEEFFYWEQVFLKRGLATFSLDGPGQGECGYRTHIRPDYEAAGSVALDALVRRTDIDRERIGAAGVSLGGYYAARVAAFDSRLKAVVDLCGPYNFGECWQGAPSLTRLAFQHNSGARSPEEAEARASQLTLEAVAARIKQPFLVIQGRLDKVIPWQQAQKIVDAIGRHAELVMFEDGNHVCNNIPYKYRPLTADWLKAKLA